MLQQQQSQKQLTLFQSVLTNLLESFSHSFCQVISEFGHLTSKNSKSSSNADKKSSRKIMKNMFKSFPRYFSNYKKIISTLADLAACNPTDIVRFCGKMMKDTLLFSNNTPLNSVQNGLSAGKVNIYDPENKQHQLIFYYFSTFFLSDLIYEIIVQFKAIKANDLLVRVGYTLANSELLIPEIDNMIFDQWAVIYSIVSLNSFQLLYDVFPTFNNFLITAQFFKYMRLDMIDRISENFMSNIFTELHKLQKKKQINSEVLEAIANLVIVFPYHEHILSKIFDIAYSYRSITENNVCNGAAILSLTIMLKSPKKKNLLNHFIEKRIFLKAENKESLKNSLKGLRIYMYGRNVKPEWLFWSWGPNPRVDPIEFIQWSSFNELNIKDQEYFNKIFIKHYFQKVTYPMDLDEISQFSSIILHLASLNFNSFLENIVPPFLKLDEDDDRYIAFIRCINNINSESFMKYSCSNVKHSDILKFNQLVHDKIILSLLSYNDYYTDEKDDESESKNKKKKKKKKKVEKIDSVAFDVRDVLATEYVSENDSKISETLEKWKLNNEFTATTRILNQTEVLEFDISIYPQLVSILNFIFTDDDFKDQKILSTLIEMSFNHNFLVSMTAFNLCKEISKNEDYNMSMLNAAVDEMKKRKTPEAFFVISTVMFYTLSNIPEPNKIKKKLLLKIESDAFLCICSGYALVRHLGFHILRKINKILGNNGLLFIIASNQAQIERSVKADILAHSARKDIRNIFNNSENFHLYNSNRINNLLYSDESIIDPSIYSYNQLKYGDYNNNNNNNQNTEDTETDVDEENSNINVNSESQDQEVSTNSNEDSDSSTNFESSTTQATSDRSSIAMNLNEISSSESNLFNISKKKKTSSNIRHVHKLSEILKAKRTKASTTAGSFFQKIFHPRKKSLKSGISNESNITLDENNTNNTNNEEEEDNESQSQTQNQEQNNQEQFQPEKKQEQRKIPKKQINNSMNADTSNNIGRLNSIIKFDTCLLSHYYDIWLIFIKHMINLIIDVNYTPLLKNVDYFRENLYDFKDPKTLPSGVGIILLLLSSQYYLPYIIQFKVIDPEKQYKPFKKHHRKGKKHRSRKKNEEDEEEKNKEDEKDKKKDKKEKKDENKSQDVKEKEKEKDKEKEKEKEKDKDKDKEKDKKKEKEKDKKKEKNKDKEKNNDKEKEKEKNKDKEEEKEKDKDKDKEKNKDKEKEKEKEKETDNYTTENETETETDFYENESTTENEYSENEESTRDIPIEKEYVYKDHREEVREILKTWLKSNDETSKHIALTMIKLIHFTLIPTVIDLLSEVRCQINYVDNTSEEEEKDQEQEETIDNNQNDINLFAQIMHSLALNLNSADLSPYFISSQIMPLIQFISNACYTFSRMHFNGTRQVEWTDEKEKETAKYSILIQDFCIICETAFNNFYIVNKEKEKGTGKDFINDIDKIWSLDNRQVMSRFFMNWLQTKSESLEKVRFYSSYALASIIKLGPIFTGNLLFDKTVGSLFGMIDVMGLNVLKPLLSYHYEQLLNKFIEAYFCEPFPVSEHYFRAIVVNITDEHSNYSSLLSGPLLFLCLVSSQLENPRSKKLIESFMRTVGPINSVDKKSQDAIIEAMLRSTPQEVIPNYFKYATEAVFAFFFEIIKKKDLKIPIKDIVESITPWITYVRLLPSQTTCAPDVSTMFAFFTPYQFLVNLMEATESVPPSQFTYMVSIWTELMKTPDHCDLIPAFIVTWGNQKTMRAISLVLFYSHPSKICQKVLPRFSFAFYFYVTVCRKFNQEQKNKQNKAIQNNSNIKLGNKNNSENNSNNENKKYNDCSNTDIIKELWMTPIVVPVLKKNWDLVLPRIGHIVHFAFLFRSKLPELFTMLCDKYKIEYPDPTFDIVHIEDTLMAFIRVMKGVKINKKSITASKIIVENIDPESNNIIEEDSYVSALELWTDEALKWTIGSPDLKYSAMSLFIYMRVNSANNPLSLNQSSSLPKKRKNSKMNKVPIPGNIFYSEMIPVDINLFRAIIRTVAYHVEHFDQEKDDEEDLAFLASESFTFISNYSNMDLNLAYQYCSSFFDCRVFVMSSLVNALPIFSKALDDPDLMNLVKINVISIIRPIIPKLEGSHHLRKEFGEFLTKARSEEMLTIIVPLKMSNPTFFTEFPKAELIMTKSSTSSLCKALVHYCLMMTTASTSLLNCIFEVSTFIINKVVEENNKYNLVRIYLQALRKISECSKAIDFIKAVSIKQPSVVGTTLMSDVFEWSRLLDDVKRNLSKYVVKEMAKDNDFNVNRSVSDLSVNDTNSIPEKSVKKKDDVAMVEVSTSSTTTENDKKEEEEEDEESNEDDDHRNIRKKTLSSLGSTSTVHQKIFNLPKHGIYSLPKSASIAVANPALHSFIRNSISNTTITDCPNYQSVMKFLEMKDTCPPKILPFESDMDLLENMSKVTRPKTSRKAFVLPKVAAQQKGVNISLTKAVISNSMRTSLQQINDNEYMTEKEGELFEKSLKPMIHPEKLIFKPEIFNPEKQIDVNFSANTSLFLNNINTASSS